MPTAKESPEWKVLIVLLPVVVGSLLGSITTITSNYYSQKLQQEEARRKEEAASRAEKISDQKKEIDTLAHMSMDFMHELEVSLGDTQQSKDALLRLEVEISLHVPSLEQDVAQVRKAYTEYLKRMEQARTGGDAGIQEFVHNYEKEIAPVMASVRSLLAKTYHQRTASAPE